MRAWGAHTTLRPLSQTVVIAHPTSLASPTPHIPHPTPIPRCHAGPRLCFVFSLSGVLFLSIIAFLLGRNSLYIKVSKEHFKHKQELAGGCWGAAFMWLGCAVISGYLWHRAMNEKEVVDEDLRLLE